MEWIKKHIYIFKYNSKLYLKQCLIYSKLFRSVLAAIIEFIPRRCHFSTKRVLI